MAIEILAELLIVGAGTWALNRTVREWRLGSFFEGLDATRQRAFLEVVAAAALEDGTLSDGEREWLDRRRDAAKHPDVVDAAIATATSVLPPRDDPEGLRSFLAERAAILVEPEQRERAFGAAAFVLARAGKPDVDVVSRLFGEALLVPASQVETVLASIATGAAL